MNWTETDLQNLKTKGLQVDGEKDAPKVKKMKIEKRSVEKDTIHTVLDMLKLTKKIEDFQTEFKFDEVRKFRFDWAIPSKKIAVEFEGLMSEKSRHTTLKGYSNDCIKYNIAQLQGWKVLRYTILNYKNIEADLEKVLEKETEAIQLLTAENYLNLEKETEEDWLLFTITNNINITTDLENPTTAKRKIPFAENTYQGFGKYTVAVKDGLIVASYYSNGFESFLSNDLFFKKQQKIKEELMPYGTVIDINAFDFAMYVREDDLKYFDTKKYNVFAIEKNDFK